MLAQLWRRPASEVLERYEPQGLDMAGPDMFAFDSVMVSYATKVAEDSGSTKGRVNRTLNSPSTQALLAFKERQLNG